MKNLLFPLLFAATALVPAIAQEEKPVPKDSVRVTVPGCSKNYMFTAGRPAEDQGGTPVPEGTHLRMNGPKKTMADIKGQEGSRIEAEPARAVVRQDRDEHLVRGLEEGVESKLAVQESNEPPASDGGQVLDGMHDHVAMI